MIGALGWAGAAGGLAPGEPTHLLCEVARVISVCVDEGWPGLDPINGKVTERRQIRCRMLYRPQHRASWRLAGVWHLEARSGEPTGRD